jgi:hypothetical protein
MTKQEKQQFLERIALALDDPDTQKRIEEALDRARALIEELERARRINRHKLYEPMTI